MRWNIAEMASAGVSTFSIIRERFSECTASAMEIATMWPQKVFQGLPAGAGDGLVS